MVELIISEVKIEETDLADFNNESRVLILFYRQEVSVQNFT